MHNFIIAQGYDVGPVVLDQDNMSCKASIKRGGPASELTRHIDIVEFSVKEKVDNKEAAVNFVKDNSFQLTYPRRGQPRSNGNTLHLLVVLIEELKSQNFNKQRKIRSDTLRTQEFLLNINTPDQ